MRASQGRYFDIWIMNADGSDERQITRAKSESTAPAWSPDGSKLAFTNNRSGGMKILVGNPDGTGLRRLTGGSGYGSFVPDWQRDPAKIVPTTTTTTTKPPTTPTTRRPTTPTTRRR
jgi:Tol biopolymer transport system component